MDDADDPNWYFQEWAGHFKKRQADLVRDLGWDKARANFVWHGKQPYRRDIVNEVSAWLGIAPFELLMPPAEALALRDLREAAKTIVAKQSSTPAAGEFRAFEDSRPTTSRKRTG